MFYFFAAFRRRLRWFLDLPYRIGRPPGKVAYIPQLDGLRFLAIFLVLIWHASLRASRHVDDLRHSGIDVKNLYSRFPHGEIGVALFFFVSGLVIAQPFLAGRVQSTWNFYMRRFRRIYPPYFVVLAASFFVLAILRTNPGHANAFYASHVSLAQSFGASLLYLHSIFFDAPSRIIPPIWSLEIEIQFYLLSPLLLALYLKLPERKARILLGAAVILALLLVSSILSYGHRVDGRFRLGLLKHLDLFLAGILAADLSTGKDWIAEVGSLKSDFTFIASLFLFLSLGLWLTQVDARPVGGVLTFASELGLLLAVIGLYHGAMYGRIARKVFAIQWLCFIGTMCYSIYLIHVPLMQFVAERYLNVLPFHNPFVIWATWLSVLICISIVCAITYYILIERPCMTPTSKRSIRVTPEQSSAPIVETATTT
jgi:peptidoglycan/LPS O-acetylase OafA/YrhL